MNLSCESKSMIFEKLSDFHMKSQNKPKIRALSIEYDTSDDLDLDWSKPSRNEILKGEIVIVPPESLRVIAKIEPDFLILKSVGYMIPKTSIYIRKMIFEIEKFKIKDFEGLNKLFAENKNPAEL